MGAGEHVGWHAPDPNKRKKKRRKEEEKICVVTSNGRHTRHTARAGRRGAENPGRRWPTSNPELRIPDEGVLAGLAGLERRGARGGGDGRRQQDDVAMSRGAPR